MKKIAMGLQPQMKQIEILLAHDLLYSDAAIQELKRLGSRFALFCDEPVAKILGSKWKEHLIKKGLDVHLFTFPAGEQEKSRGRKGEL